MTHYPTELLKRALALSAEERAELAGSLLESLDGAPDDPEAVEAAANRALRRDGVATRVSGQAGWRRETNQGSQRKGRTEPRCHLKGAMAI